MDRVRGLGSCKAQRVTEEALLCYLFFNKIEVLGLKISTSGELLLKKKEAYSFRRASEHRVDKYLHFFFAKPPF